MSTTEKSGSLAEDFVTLNTLVRAEGGRDAALQRLVELAVAVVPGCAWAGVTTWPASRPPQSLATSDEVASRADEFQYEIGDGPCLKAAADSEVVHVDDIGADDRWPKLAAKYLTETPVRGVLSFHLADEPHGTALNLYAGEVDAFDYDAVSMAALFAAHARVLLMHLVSTDNAAQLKSALSTSRQIGAAMGILMSVHKITAEQAFDLLRVSSQHLHRKLHDIAYDVTQTGALPERS